MPRWPSPYPRRRPRRRTLGLAGLIAAVIAGLVWGATRPPPPANQAPPHPAPVHAPAPAKAPATGPAPAHAPAQAPASTALATADGRTIDDPAEARGIRDTLQIIARGPPFPFAQDGTTYRNRGRNLPERSAGWYKEYTVVTPGSPDRGARRLVIGKDGEVWYTHDHYRSFLRLVVPPQ